VDTYFAPADQTIEHGREDGDRCCRVENSRDSEPEEIHYEVHLKSVAISIL
jgi:hypothetical protein